jgi:hypothetical protein
MVKLDLDAEQNNRRGLQQNVSKLDELERIVVSVDFIIQRIYTTLLRK